MKKTLLPTIYTFIISFFLCINFSNAQVGIGTTTPQPGSILDISTSNKGVLVPRVNIASLNTIAPITGGATEGLLVYNTNATTGAGFHYWNNTVWVPIISKDWKQGGNTGTNPATDFIGTIDNTDLRFRTNNANRLEITSAGLFRAFSPGTVTNPLLAWDIDSDTGIYRGADDQLNLAAGGLEFISLQETANNTVVINETGVDMNTRIETNNNPNTLFIDGANDNIGIGTGTPNNSAQLEIADTDKGFLINRVALTATNSATPITAPATGLLVYNTVNSSSGSTEVLPGFYYWDGSRWVAMGGTGGKDWSLEGNAGTSLFANFLGTTDAISLNFKTNNLQRMQIDVNGTVGIGNNPFTDTALRVNNAAQPYGVIAQTSSDGVSLYGSDTGTGLGVYGTSTNNHGIFGTTDYTGSIYLIGGIIGWGGGFNGANGVLAVADQNATSNSNMGIRAVAGSTTSISSSTVMDVAVNANAIDLGLYVMTEKSTGEREAARFQTNYSGSPIDADSRDTRAMLAGYTNNSMVGGNNMYYGGFFYSGGVSNGSYAYAGARYGNTNYKIIGNGTVSTIVDGIDNSKKVMFAAEAPEVLFEDYGTGELVNGMANIAIDPIFSNNIIVDASHPLKVFIQLEGDSNGVYVTNKSATGFEVRELQSGTASVTFSWHIVANRKDDVGPSSTGESQYSSLRFPDAPGALQSETMTAKVILKSNPYIDD
ncbi:hypothetical protein ATE92_1539 [Ulvibacter sp. MAR_2010_11]|uniref:hypothetical protein n=1 Tax=Ulvibacter sp. MAR_2010_11 TaxID=1250229 RepID=UPI000C2C4DC1|nr:hypothetical protein [Ulvibacter sp. MAR_2010_11]PKA83387.1 hypothetical protein ATE92_1539 [Ulvibacter sp. MAR_2010_11]